MSLCFFTMANTKKIDWAERLLASGSIVDRSIWFYRIPPDNSEPNRYKIELLMGDQLPSADKYIYLDADTIMLSHGDWEAEDCEGGVLEDFRHDFRRFFDREDAPGYEAFLKLFLEYNSPEIINTGCMVLSANIRKRVAHRWMEWCLKIDSLCTRRTNIRDQIHFAFVRKELNLPILPDRFSVIIKRKKVLPYHISIHAAGKPHGTAMEPYHTAVRDILGGYLRARSSADTDCRWQLATRLILLYAENPTFPVGAEVGIGSGKNVRHLLRTFPGLRLHCIDDWAHNGGDYSAWTEARKEFSDRVVEHRALSDSVIIKEPLDFVFINTDHRKEQAVKDINHWFSQVRSGGFVIGHDVNYESRAIETGDIDKVASKTFGGGYYKGPDYTWWKAKGPTLKAPS